jgi:hypothetical protein
MLRKMLFGCALATLVSLGTPAFAQEPTNQLTYFTFSAPFELPGGKVLPAGKYTFRIVDSPSNRHVVQILSEDGKEMHATLLAIPAQRQDPPDEPEVRFMETAASMPPAVRTWWYPGRTIGHEFIYPKDHARRLAARQSESVLTVQTDVTDTEQMRTAELTRIDASGKETRVAAVTTDREGSAAAIVDRQQTQTQTQAAVTTETQRETTTARVETPAPAPAPAPPPAPAVTVERETRTTAVETPAPREAAVETTRVEETRTELPRTATMLPLIGLIGLASLIGAAALRRRQ